MTNPEVEKLASRPEYFPPKHGEDGLRGTCDSCSRLHRYGDHDVNYCKNWHRSDLNADARRRAVEMAERIERKLPEYARRTFAEAVAEIARETERCPDCDEAAKHAYSDAHSGGWLELARAFLIANMPPIKVTIPSPHPVLVGDVFQQSTVEDMLAHAMQMTADSMLDQWDLDESVRPKFIERGKAALRERIGKEKKA